MKNYRTILLSVLLTVLSCLILSCELGQESDDNQQDQTADGGDLGADNECESFSCPLQSVALTDVNPSSQTYEQDVAPADYLGWVSGWYFGHST